MFYFNGTHKPDAKFVPLYETQQVSCYGDRCVGGAIVKAFVTLYGPTGPQKFVGTADQVPHFVENNGRRSS